MDQVNVHDEDGTDTDKIGNMLIFGHVDESKLHGLDANGKADLVDATNGALILFSS